MIFASLVALSLLFYSFWLNYRLKQEEEVTQFLMEEELRRVQGCTVCSSAKANRQQLGIKVSTIETYAVFCPLCGKRLVEEV